MGYSIKGPVLSSLRVLFFLSNRVPRENNPKSTGGLKISKGRAANILMMTKLQKNSETDGTRFPRISTSVCGFFRIAIICCVISRPEK